MTIGDLYEQYEEDILVSNEEYREKMGMFKELREKIDSELSLTKEQRQILEEVIDMAFDTEGSLHKQCFIKGFEMARDLLKS